MSIDQVRPARDFGEAKCGLLCEAPRRAPLRRNTWIVRITPVVVISQSCTAESLWETRSWGGAQRRRRLRTVTARRLADARHTMSAAGAGDVRRFTSVAAELEGHGRGTRANRRRPAAQASSPHGAHGNRSRHPPRYRPRPRCLLRPCRFPRHRCLPCRCLPCRCLPCRCRALRRPGSSRLLLPRPRHERIRPTPSAPESPHRCRTARYARRKNPWSRAVEPLRIWSSVKTPPAESNTKTSPSSRAAPVADGDPMNSVSPSMAIPSPVPVTYLEGASAARLV